LPIHGCGFLVTLIVTHDQVEAMGLFDRIVVMNKGRIEPIGSPEEIYRYQFRALSPTLLGEQIWLKAVLNRSMARR
jgi:ABC-type sugar transport system ATPase subunit